MSGHGPPNTFNYGNYSNGHENYYKIMIHTNLYVISPVHFSSLTIFKLCKFSPDELFYLFIIIS